MDTTRGAAAQSAEAKPEPFSMLVHAIENDLARTPDGMGGTVTYKPATNRAGGMGHNGDYLLKEWREVTAALAAERDRADQAEAALAASGKLGAYETGRTIGEAAARKAVDEARDQIARAPHGDNCEAPVRTCTCWKSEATA